MQFHNNTVGISTENSFRRQHGDHGHFRILANFPIAYVTDPLGNVTYIAIRFHFHVETLCENYHHCEFSTTFYVSFFSNNIMIATQRATDVI